MQTGHKKESKALIVVIIAAVLLTCVLFLIVMVSLLRNLVFSPDTEPSLVLEVVESTGPDPATGFYRVVVEAKADGKPEPQVTFNRNDGVDQMEANHALVLLEDGNTFLLQAVAKNPLGTADAELELFAGMMIGSASGRTGDFEDDEDDPAAPGERDPERTGPFPPADPGETEPDRFAPDSPGSPGDGDSDAFAHQITALFYRHDEDVCGERVSDWIDITGVVLSVEEAITLHDYGFFHIFEIATFDFDDEDLWDYINIEVASGRIIYRSNNRSTNRIHFVWQIDELREEERGDFNSSATVTLSYPPGTEDRKTIRVFSPARIADPDVFIEERHYSSFEIAPDASSSGFVASDGEIMTGVILLGDSDANRQYKGYLSFPAHYLGPAAPNLRVEAVDLVFNNINISGNPQDMASLVDFKWFDYGDRLYPFHFRVGGTRLFTLDSSEFNTADGNPLVISGSEMLAELFSSRLAAGGNVQIKMGLNRATNHNDEADIFQMHTGSVRLVVRFSYTVD